MIKERPNSVLTWGNSLNTLNCIEPSLGQKVTGWNLNDEPAAEWMNWFQNTVSSYIAHLEESAAGWALNFSEVDIFSDANSTFDIFDVAHGPLDKGSYAIRSFVFVGNSNEIISASCTTPGEITAAAFDLGISVIYSIEYGNGYWFLSTSSTQYYSDDYLSSFSENNIGGTIYRMKYANGYWVCASTGGILYRQTDPTGAFSSFTDPPTVYDVDFSLESDLWGAVDAAGNFWYRDSTPAGDWTDVSLGSNALRCLTHGVVNGVDVWLAGGENNELYRSTNPKVSWEQITSPFHDDISVIRTVSWGNGIFLIGAQWNRAGAYISRDGYMWHEALTNHFFFASDYYANRFVVSGSSSGNGNTQYSLRHGGLDDFTPREYDGSIE